ncbi:Protein CBG10407 [Caenorhabditis briggsae]|uniref:Protein CBG10407 n=1 Tax=Caenorhabditis briggsae TaxID=6238 RepID=A8XB49_CAEBR|nr:Protein CBG10407 [Caenorhabditis briggsae]CAP29829.1 Protein CBG10407 [Caenorhabditis briggsae]
MALCKIVSMSVLPNNCLIVVGDILIDSDSEKHIRKLERVSYLFGSLTVNSTSLNNLDSFYAIQAIEYFGNGPVIRITSNKNMKSAKFHTLNNIYTRDGAREALIQDNHKDIFKEHKEKCNLIEPSEKYWVCRARMKFTGGDCGQMVNLTELDLESYSEASFSNIGFLIMACFLVFWFQFN